MIKGKNGTPGKQGASVDSEEETNQSGIVEEDGQKYKRDTDIKTILFIQRREPMEDQVKVNSGCKPADGITNGMLNKIMLEMAYDRLPLELRRVAYYRWVIKGQYSLLQTLTILGLTKDQYYYRCDQVVNSVFEFVNGYK